MPEALPNLFIVGAMRAGTTSVFHWLSQHPEVWTSDPKEPHWFAFPDRAPAYTGPGDEQLNERIVWRRDDYHALFAGGADHRYRAEASAMYLHLPEAIDRLIDPRPGERGDDARFVVLLRDPVERAISAHAFNRMRDREPHEALADALAEEDERRRSGWSPMFWYAGAGMIADQLDRLLDAAPDRTLVLRQLDLERDPEGTARRLFDWLGLEAPSDLDVTPRNRSGDAQSAIVGRLLAHGPVKRRLKPLVPRALRRRLEHAREANRTGPPPVDAATRRILAERVAADTARQSARIGQSLTD